MSRLRNSYKWELLLLLWIAYFLNQGDRQIYSAVLPLIKADLKLSDVQLGLVATTFTLLYGVFVPLAGCLGDFVAKKWIVCLSLLTFSIGTLLTGISGGLIALIVFRSVATGVGESFYYPAANSLIGHYHRDTRAQAMAIHQTSLYIGVVASSWIAAWIGEQHGWRTTFYAFGSLGMLLAVIVAFRLRNEHRDAVVSEAVAPEPVKLREALRTILKTPTLYFLSFAFGGMVFVSVGWITWMPTFLYEKFHMPLKDAALHAMLIHHIFAFLGVMVGGRVSDRMATRRRSIRLEIEILGLALGAPFIWLIGASPSLTIVYVALAGFGLFRGLYDSNLFATLFDVIPLRYRSTATGVMLSCAFTVGATSPMLLGYVKQHIDLGVGLSWLAIVYALGAVILFVALRKYFLRDYVEENPSPRTV
ncbi:MAG: MFS transporter [Opitutaceae bacterium]|nr:MFS transporter [Opitutaceae bacterium]